MNPRTGITQSTPLAGEPLEPLGYFSAALIKTAYSVYQTGGRMSSEKSRLFQRGTAAAQQPFPQTETIRAGTGRKRHQPSAISMIIMTTKPTMTPIVAMLECAPDCDSGMSSSTTT